MILEFDIDNTLVTQGTPGEYLAVEPLQNAVETVNKFYDLGHNIILHTARHWKYFDLTYKSMKELGFKFHSLLMGKVNADVIIDDRAVSSIEELTMDIFDRAYELCERCEKDCETRDVKKQELEEIRAKIY